VLYDSLKQNGAGSLIQPYVQPSTLKGYVKERSKNSNKLPEGVEITPKNRVRIRGLKSKTQGE
jgi:hypothetical protein